MIRKNKSQINITANDVDITTNKVNGYALQYNSINGKFESQPLPTGIGSGATSLDGLTDVDLITFTPVEGDFLKFTGGIWKTSSAPVIVVPQPVTGLQANSITQTTVILSWLTSDTSTSYDIFKDNVFLDSTSSTNYTVINLLSNTIYSFTVKAKNTAGSSTGASVNAVTLSQPIPQPVTGLQASNVLQASLTLSWQLSSGATSYDILLNGNFLVNSSSNTYDITGLIQGTQYSIVVKAKNDVGTSSSATISVTTLTPSVDSLVFNVEFGGKFGSTSNTINDTVSNTPCTLYNVAHDGTTSGYVNNDGLLLTTSGYVGIPSNTGSLYNSLNCFNTTGITIEFRAYNAIGVAVRNNPTTFKIAMGTTVSNDSVKYISNIDGTTKSGGWSFGGAFKDLETGTPTNSILSSINPTTELNIVVFRIYPNGNADIIIDGRKSTTVSSIADFSQYADMLIGGELFIRRDEVGQNKSPTTLVGFSMYNKILTDQEVLQSYKNHKNLEPLKSVTNFSDTINLNVGETQVLAPITSPIRYGTLISKTYESGNSGFVTVNSDGVLTAIFDGTTTVSITSTYQTQTFVDYVTVNVGSFVATAPTSSRTVVGISLNRQTSTLDVGENFVVMATTLPFDVYDDNIVIWESSNTNVCRVNLGVLEGVSAGTATITAHDGTKTYSQSFTVTVQVPVVVAITSGQTYNAVLSDYGILSDNTGSTATTNGIQAALNYASANGYKKIVFPFGTYLVSPVARTISLPTQMAIDFSNSVINIEFSSMTTSIGYHMFSFDGVSNTKLINANIYGEADYTTVDTSTERCLSVYLSDAINSGVENCTFSKSPGFNFLGNVKTKVGTIRYPINKNLFVAGSIDVNGADDNSITTYSYRFNNYLSIAGLGTYYSMGYSQGYYGYNYLRSRLYSIFFYDINHVFISSQMYNLQFYTYDKPTNAMYVKIIIYQQDAPASMDLDFNAVAFISTLAMPYRCFIRNCTFEDNSSSGIAMCGGQNWLIENNHFSRNGKRAPACDIDWEDGWDTMVGDIVRNNTFNSPSGVNWSAGASLALLNNTFNKSCLTVYGRSQNFRVSNNYFNDKENFNVALIAQAESYFSRNVLYRVIYTIALQHGIAANYRIRDTDNTLL